MRGGVRRSPLLARRHSCLGREHGSCASCRYAILSRKAFSAESWCQVPFAEHSSPADMNSVVPHDHTCSGTVVAWC